MINSEFEKSKIYIIVGMDHFIPHGVFIKTILKRPTGNVNAVFIDKGEQFTEKLSRFDTLFKSLKEKQRF